MTRPRPKIVNIAAYKFVQLDPEQLRQLQREMRAICERENLKGTILLSPEGINLVLAGAQDNIDSLWRFLTSKNEFSDMTDKASFSDRQPFRRLIVKIKKELIPLEVRKTSSVGGLRTHLSPISLKRWLDEGRDFTLLDTRNDYEVVIGRFEQARDLKIQCFRAFPDALAQLEPESKEKPLVTYCTGGIRCEKAMPLMIERGFKEVYQLEGGILNYFEACSGDYFTGECFVFDERISLDARLQPTESILCGCCQFPVTQEEQQLPSYVPGRSCPRCVERESSWAENQR